MLNRKDRDYEEMNTFKNEKWTKCFKITTKLLLGPCMEAQFAIKISF